MISYPMATCQFCEKGAVRKARVFLGRRKATEVPLCVEHWLWAKGVEKVQKPIRDLVGRTIPKSYLPRIKTD